MEQGPDDALVPDRPVKGRGSLSSRDGRFERLVHQKIDDGWARLPEPPPRTRATREFPKRIITRNASPDVGFETSINPYRGCEHGCVYCYARPTHAYNGLSPGLDFETRLFEKPNAAALLRAELSARGYRCKPIMLGANTDAYQPLERDRGITRSILELLAETDHPALIVTKSGLVTRDLDLLAPMAARNLVAVAVSITTLDHRLANKMEPRAVTPSLRLKTVRALSEAGVPVMVMVAPIVPALTDWEIERILDAAAEHGASRAGYVLLRLPLEIKDLVGEWLEAHKPGMAKKVMNRMREMRDGNYYVSQFGTRMRGTGKHADLIAERFRLACKKNGLAFGTAAESRLDTTRFRPPPRDARQMALL